MMSELMEKKQEDVKQLGFFVGDLLGEVPLFKMGEKYGHYDYIIFSSGLSITCSRRYFWATYHIIEDYEPLALEIHKCYIKEPGFDSDYPTVDSIQGAACHIVNKVRTHQEMIGDAYDTLREQDGTKETKEWCCDKARASNGWHHNDKCENWVLTF